MVLRSRIGILGFVLLFCFASIHMVSSDDYDEYVREVLEEEQMHYGDDHYQDQANADDYYEQQRKMKEEAARRQKEQEERSMQEQADRIAAERERAFQAELARMDAEQQKAAMKKKKKDSKLVRSILKAAKNGKHYNVLGLKNWDVRIPARTVNLGAFKFTIPGVTVKQTTTKDIRKAYRNRAMAVHPDKNRDGHAEEAFIAVENSASILSNEEQRQMYDEELNRSKQKRNSQSKALVLNAVSSVQSFIAGILKGMHMVLGPFATPVIIIGALII